MSDNQASPSDPAQPGSVNGGPDTPPPVAGGQVPTPPPAPPVQPQAQQPAAPTPPPAPPAPPVAGQTPPPPPPVQPPGQAGYQQPGQYPGQAPNAGYQQPGQPPAVPTTNTNAIVALAMAIGSWILCGLLLSIPALFVAKNAQKQIDASQGWSTGTGLVKAAKIIAWLNIILGILAIIFFVIMMIFAANDPEFQKQLISPSATPTGL